MVLSHHFLSGSRATRVVRDFGKENDQLRDVIGRVLKENKQLARPTAKILGVSHQTLLNWCETLRVPFLNREEASRRVTRSPSKKRQQFLRDFGQAGWSFSDALAMLIEEVADRDITTAAFITGIDDNLLRSWCNEFNITYFTSTLKFFNNSHKKVVRRIEKKFRHLGNDWGAIIKAAMELHEHDIYPTARFLEIENVTLVRWCAYWEIPFVTNSQCHFRPSKKFPEIVRRFARNNQSVS